MPKLPPDINDYLEQISDGEPISTDGLEKLIYKIVVHTGIKYEVSEIIIKHYFQILRNAMLRGDIIYLNNIGKLYIQCPQNGTSKKKIMPVIRAFKNLNKKIKYDD